MGDPSSIFSGIGDLIDKVKRPPDLLLAVGLGLFGWGVVKGPFGFENALISVGLICTTAAMALRLFSDSVSYVSDAYSEFRFIRWRNIIGGIIFAVAASILLYHQIAHHWFPFYK